MCMWRGYTVRVFFYVMASYTVPWKNNCMLVSSQAQGVLNCLRWQHVRSFVIVVCMKLYLEVVFRVYNYQTAVTNFKCVARLISCSSEAGEGLPSTAQPPV